MKITKEQYLKSKESYDRWRKINTHAQAWHQFNHTRRKNNKKEYSFSKYLNLRKVESNLDSRGNLKSSFTRKLP